MKIFGYIIITIAGIFFLCEVDYLKLEPSSAFSVGMLFGLLVDWYIQID